eukprot:21082-Rhodomonas_salina.3
MLVARQCSRWVETRKRKCRPGVLGTSIQRIELAAPTTTALLQRVPGETATFCAIVVRDRVVAVSCGRASDAAGRA